MAVFRICATGIAAYAALVLGTIMFPNTAPMVAGPSAPDPRMRFSPVDAGAMMAMMPASPWVSPPMGHFANLERNARPSTNIEDHRGGWQGPERR